jgi:hypothetical protein
MTRIIFMTGQMKKLKRVTISDLLPIKYNPAVTFKDSDAQIQEKLLFLYTRKRKRETDTNKQSPTTKFAKKSPRPIESIIKK